MAYLSSQKLSHTFLHGVAAASIWGVLIAENSAARSALCCPAALLEPNNARQQQDERLERMREGAEKPRQPDCKQLKKILTFFEEHPRPRSLRSRR